jgi:hypothetical protein
MIAIMLMQARSIVTTLIDNNHRCVALISSTWHVVLLIIIHSEVVDVVGVERIRFLSGYILALDDKASDVMRSSMALRSVRFGMRLQELSNFGQ